MLFQCVCDIIFEVGGENSILPDHKDQDGDPCLGSNQSIKDMYQTEETTNCPLGLDDSCCATCVSQSCLSDDDEKDSVED